MENIDPSPPESGFLTDCNNSRWTTPRGSLYNRDEEEEEELEREKYFKDFTKKNNPNKHDRSENRLDEEALREVHRCLGGSGDSDSKEKKGPLCRRSLQIPLLYFCLSVVVLGLLGVLIYCFVGKNPREPPCEESWMWFGDHCYYFSEGSDTWNNSQEFCRRHGSTLAVLNDPAIKKTIERYRENVNYWIGLRRNRDGRWMWDDGSLYDGSVENGDIPQLSCAFLNSHLGALDCSTGRQWICVKDSS
ncbi:killer cell lectin-like receptor subfamily G member 1 [Engystomops pustulosus]|uniref:killer cell lectin-like receptor subfamily G member 1 n=1 Tax=Engystomops pustulosus TaxID=76066 RepID=UPI003AFA052F